MEQTCYWMLLTMRVVHMHQNGKADGSLLRLGERARVSQCRTTRGHWNYLHRQKGAAGRTRLD